MIKKLNISLAAGLTFFIPLLQSCHGILGNIYDEPPIGSESTKPGQLYIDASDWTQWHYIDLEEINRAAQQNPSADVSAYWKTYSIPPGVSQEYQKPIEQLPGIYTYWYDVFGAGLSVNEFQYFSPTEPQDSPQNWTFAVHRNNIRTNSAAAAITPYTDIDSLPEDRDWLTSLDYSADQWNTTDVWTVQERMLNGVVGNQGIEINPTLGEWLGMEIPPMPPAFHHKRNVFILRLDNGEYAALQLADYIGSDGVKCKLTINYRYPL